MKSAIYLDSFSGGISDMSRKDQADSEKVLAVLKREKRFSSFDASDNPTIARTIDRLMPRLTTTGEYPWHIITHVDGEAV